MNELFNKRVEEYFKQDSMKYLESLKKPCSQGFFLNTNKANRIDILNIVDFKYEESTLTNDSFYHNEDNIGKSKAYELGLIYPQEIGASLTSKFIDNKDVKLIVDLCAAPGGKTINILNRVNRNALCISNDVNYKRVLTLSQNIERLGLDNVIITNKEPDLLAKQLEGQADIVILDAPCSGEGMIRKYPEILDDYSLENIINLANIQKGLLENAYTILKKGGTLIYSTCTFAFEEDENQVTNFLNNHSDMKLIKLPISYQFASNLEGTSKLSPINNTEGQFIAMMKKDGETISKTLTMLKPVKEKLVDDFIKENIDLDSYFLYKHNDHFYISENPLIDLKNNVIRYGVDVGEIVNKRFEPSHTLYRSSLNFKYKYDLNDSEYDKYISGNELVADVQNHYYQITYKGFALGFGKASQGHIKNKYPKGLRRMV